MSLQPPLRSREISETKHSLDVGSDAYCEAEVVVSSEDFDGHIHEVVKFTRSINDEAFSKTTVIYFNKVLTNTNTAYTLSNSWAAELQSKWKENWKPKTRFLGDEIEELKD